MTKKINKPQKFALIIGAMKSGTSYLYNLLVQHPEIAKCIIKEPFFFVHYKNEECKWKKGMNYYESLWPDWDSAKHKYALEASTSYSQASVLQNSAERIATVKDKEFKFIYIIRNPLDRIRSELSFGTTYWRQRGQLDSNYHKNLDDSTIEITKYAAQLDEYKKRFGRENILILMYEDLKSDPLSVTNKVFRFLNIDSYPIELSSNKNKTSDKAYLPIVYKIRQMIPISLSFKNLLPSFLLELLKDKDLVDLKLTPDQEKHILEELHDDIKRLRTEYGVKIERWNLDI